MFNLAPIGMGRASFRLAEIVQIGRIPVYLYEDFPWSPYEGSGRWTVVWCGVVWCGVVVFVFSAHFTCLFSVLYLLRRIRHCTDLTLYFSCLSLSIYTVSCVAPAVKCSAV
jgi:hypothetical protein